MTLLKKEQLHNGVRTPVDDLGYSSDEDTRVKVSAAARRHLPQFVNAPAKLQVIVEPRTHAKKVTPRILASVQKCPSYL
jgi:hypothetical protein